MQSEVFIKKYCTGNQSHVIRLGFGYNPHLDINICLILSSYIWYVDYN